ncbi:S-layer homology domain-containing protein [Candidatus Saganbacteria bacterium]|nr:S-layer homology domain-containing protein [Candidatus Saganbacteria bacterium]
MTPDKLITNQATVKVEGIVKNASIASVKVNNSEVILSSAKKIEISVSLKAGKNLILVEGFNSAGKLVETIKLRVLRLVTYSDVSEEFWGSEQISYIGTLGIIQGYPDGGFQPDGEITRAELATLLVRTQISATENISPNIKTIFSDVPLTHWATTYISNAAANGIVAGYPDGTFKPADNVTRAEGLAMIARFGKVRSLNYSGVEFPDITTEHWASSIIAGAYQEGLLNFLANKAFEPNLKLTRAEAVEMLYRSKPIITLLEDLKDFEKGY